MYYIMCIMCNIMYYIMCIMCNIMVGRSITHTGEVVHVFESMTDYHEVPPAPDHDQGDCNTGLLEVKVGRHEHVHHLGSGEYLRVVRPGVVYYLLLSFYWYSLPHLASIINTAI